MGGDDEVYRLLELADEAANPGLKYYNLQYKGFFAVKATKTSHVAEFFVVTPETVLSNYSNARAASSGGLVADFMCDAQLVTTAGEPGSLERGDACSVIEFDTARPAVWSLPVPTATTQSLETTALTDCGHRQCEFDVATPEKDNDDDEKGVPPSDASPTDTPPQGGAPTSGAASGLALHYGVVLVLFATSLHLLWNSGTFSVLLY